MNVFNMFEDRVSALFGAVPGGQTAPFSSKKLAKRAAREMEGETYVINGVDTAPALYTILVSQSDEQVIRPVYEQLTGEIANFVEAQANKKGYSFVGEPLVRFMADPELRNGRFSVFAENIDARTLKRLREEEDEYMGKSPRRSSAPARSRTHTTFSASQPAFASDDSGSYDPNAGLDRMPDAFSEGLASADVGKVPVVTSAPAPSAARIASTPLVDPYASAGAAAGQEPRHRQSQHAQHAAASAQPSCMLIDRSTGRTYTATGTRTLIGRERGSGGIVLDDPNVSRRHAELAFDGTDWHITDLDSTNGTLVNNEDIDDCNLRDGDLITMGLVNLEFREG